MKVKVFKILGDYVAVEVPLEYAINVVNILRDGLKRGGEDVKDTIRMIEHFDTFYDLMKRKFKEYLTPRKDISDIIKKKVLIDKVKLIKRDDGKFIEIVLDKSITIDDVLNILVSNGIEVSQASRF